MTTTNPPKNHPARKMLDTEARNFGDDELTYIGYSRKTVDARNGFPNPVPIEVLIYSHTTNVPERKQCSLRVAVKCGGVQRASVIAATVMLDG